MSQETRVVMIKCAGIYLTVGHPGAAPGWSGNRHVLFYRIDGVPMNVTLDNVIAIMNRCAMVRHQDYPETDPAAWTYHWSELCPGHIVRGPMVVPPAKVVQP